MRKTTEQHRNSVKYCEIQKRYIVILSFFRATTESALFEGKNIIYAVEEPETSQHPDAQRMIVNTFKEMTEKTGVR